MCVLGGVISPWDHSRGRSPHQPPPRLPEHSTERRQTTGFPQHDRTQQSSMSITTLQPHISCMSHHFHSLTVALNSLTSSSASSPSSSYCKTQMRRLARKSQVNLASYLCYYIIIWLYSN